MTPAPSNPLGWPTWAWRWLLALTSAMALYTVVGGLAGLALSFTPLQAFRTFGGLAVTVFAALLLARGSDNRAAALLGVILVAYVTIVAVPPVISGSGFADQAQLIFMFALVAVRSACIGFLWPLFSLEVSGGARSKAQDRLVRALALVTAVMTTAGGWALLLPSLRPLGAGILALGILGNQLLGYWVLASNYGSSDAAGRNRIKIVLPAFVFFLVASMASVFGIADYEVQVSPALVPAAFLVGAALLAYAVLRKRLFDFNFALNRTLVYATVSFILLAAFGGAKWVIEHLIPPAWHEGSEYYSFAIALGLFLSLHRVHNWVERGVERVLFRSWHDNETALRRFVAAAGHFEGSRELCRAFAQELSRFAGGAGAALYVSGADGGHCLCAGKLARARKSYAGDERALALMRAEREPVRLAQAHSALPGELALPMLDQARLAAFVLLGRKGDGTDYRPDEVEALGWAAHQIGLDLQAMHARELEAENASLRAQLARRRGTVRLAAVSGGGAP